MNYLIKFSLVVFALTQVTVFGQQGYVQGLITDAVTHEEIITAKIYNDDFSVIKLSDYNGKYSLELKPGKQYVNCQFIGYETDSVEVNVVANETVDVDFKLVESRDVMDVVIVTSQRISSSAVATLSFEKEAKTVTDGIGKEEMSDRGVSDAADAVKQVPGATVEGGKYVYVRGLSDRYSKTVLNGADIPGLDPNRNSVQMDLFPSSLIENIVVYKSFSPELPGSFTGGLVDIKTKEFPNQFTLLFSAKFGFNTQSSLNSSFLTQNGESLDNLAMGASQRELPSYISNTSVEDFPNPGLDNEKLNEYGKSFKRDFDPIQNQSGLNGSYAFSVGNSIKLNTKSQYPKLGYFVGASYKKSFNYYDNGEQGRYKLTGSTLENDKLNTELNLEDTKGVQDVIWGTLGNLSLQVNENNTISFIGNRFQNGINSVRYLEGKNYSDASDSYFQTRTLLYQQRELTNSQLKGTHHLFASKDNDLSVKMNWIGSYTNSTQKTPELKFFTNDYVINESQDTLYDLQPALYSDPSQFSRLMTEDNLNVKVDFEIPFAMFGKEKTSENILKIGGYYLSKYRSFTEKRYDFVTQSGVNTNYDGNVNDYVADDMFNSGDYTNGFIYVQNASEKRNNYIGTETNYSAYALTDLVIGKRLDVRIGARVEMNDIYAKSMNPNDVAGSLSNIDLLPSLNTTYEVIKDTFKIRLGYSRTLARPSFRELAPFSSFDFVGGNVFVGNPDLKRTLVDNIDLRFEYYPTYRENISLGLFAKSFTNPIERAFNPEAANAELTWKNVDNAKVYGAELEFSKHLKKGVKFVEDLTLGGNFTYVKSIVSIPVKELVVIQDQDPSAKDTREMFGQSPFIINAFVNYKNKSGINANVNFSVSGKQISVITIGATPNVYQQARPKLGVNISKKINNFSLKLSADNLLDSKYLSSYSYKGEEYIFSSYTKGRTFSFKIAYSL
jgi:TonB-dependent receptor